MLPPAPICPPPPPAYLHHHHHFHHTTSKSKSIWGSRIRCRSWVWRSTRITASRIICPSSTSTRTTTRSPGLLPCVGSTTATTILAVNGVPKDEVPLLLTSSKTLEDFSSLQQPHQLFRVDCREQELWLENIHTATTSHHLHPL